MKNSLTKIDYIFWLLIAVYTGIIYSTLSMVSVARKALVEKFGYGVFDSVYWVFGILGCVAAVYIIKKYKGRQLVRALAAFVIMGCVYAHYLTGLEYAIERVHFLEYGLLGALVYAAVTRHINGVSGLIVSVCVIYWLGLGDEAIQWALPGRVGEVRDCILNAFSGVLGMCVLVFLRQESVKGTDNSCGRNLWAAGCLALTTVFTGLFLIMVHGFGYIHEGKVPGRIYSSLSVKDFAGINEGVSVSQKARGLYEDEGARHLLQREFYCSNDFLAADGSYYRQWDKCLNEHLVLEFYYPQFIKQHKQDDVYTLLASYDLELAKAVKGNSVFWPDSVKNMHKWAVEGSNKIFTSRVKSTIITSYKMRDLLFYMVLILLGLCWWAVTINKLSSFSN